MSGDSWVVLLAAVLPVLAILGFAAVIGRIRGPEADALGAEPEDRPLPAVIANPTKVDPETRRQIRSVCAAQGWAEPLWLETTLDDPGTGQAREAVERGADVVLACGGDGTVRAVAEALAGTGVAMGLVPAGTGNLLARTIGTPQEVAAATRVALAGDDRKIDVGRVRVDDEPDERVFLVMAGTGFDAAIMANTPEALKVRVGPLAYVISGFRAMRGRRARVVADLRRPAAAAPAHPDRGRRQQRHAAGRAGADAQGSHRRRCAGRGQHRPEHHRRLAGGGRPGDHPAARAGTSGWSTGRPARSSSSRPSRSPRSSTGTRSVRPPGCRSRSDPASLVMRVPVPPAPDAPDPG